MRWNESSVTEGMLAALGGVAPPQANILYLVFGCILGATNLIIFAAIMRHRALRNHKEYALLGLLVFFNSLLGVAFASAGIYRLQLKTHELIHVRECLKYPHILLFAGTPSTGSLLLPCVAVDRLLAVSRPFFYYSLHIDYAIGIVLAVSFFFISCTSFALTLPLSSNFLVPNICDTRDVFGTNYKTFEAAVIAFGHFAAVALYMLVICVFRYKVRPKKLERDSGSQLKKEARIVQTFGAFAIFTFMMVVLPYSIVFILSLLCPPFSGEHNFASLLYIIVSKFALLNPTVNVFVYALRHNEISVGMPNSTDQWWVGHAPHDTKSPPTQNRNHSISLDMPTAQPRHKYSLAHHQLSLMLAGTT